MFPSETKNYQTKDSGNVSRLFLIFHLPSVVEFCGIKLDRIFSIFQSKAGAKEQGEPFPHHTFMPEGEGLCLKTGTAVRNGAGDVLGPHVF